MQDSVVHPMESNGASLRRRNPGNFEPCPSLAANPSLTVKIKADKDCNSYSTRFVIAATREEFRIFVVTTLKNPENMLVSGTLLYCRRVPRLQAQREVGIRQQCHVELQNGMNAINMPERPEPGNARQLSPHLCFKAACISRL